MPVSNEAVFEKAKTLYPLEDCEFRMVSGHEGGRNLVCIAACGGEDRYVLRFSGLGDRSEEEYLAETEFIRYLALNGAPVADVIPSVRGRLVECLEAGGKQVFASLFTCAKGMLLCDN